MDGSLVGYTANLWATLFYSTSKQANAGMACCHLQFLLLRRLYARFDNGDMLTLRQWARPRFDFDPSLNRYMYLRKLAQDSYKAEYGLGPSAVFTPLGW